jgi:hypothetical protein
MFRLRSLGGNYLWLECMELNTVHFCYLIDRYVLLRAWMITTSGAFAVAVFYYLIVTASFRPMTSLSIRGICFVPSTFTISKTTYPQQLCAGKCFFSTHASHHAKAMLTYPDRHKFEQIRAQWETSGPGETKAAAMVGWREKPAAHQPVSSEPHENGGKKFRRKLSYGLSFISNPLSQRKTTPGRHQVNVPSLAVTEPSATDITTTNPTYDSALSPLRTSTPPKSSNETLEEPATVPLSDILSKIGDADITPQRLPRSRTLSFIPLPVRVEPKSFSADVEGAVKSHSLAAMLPSERDSVPSKIPTPSPPSLERRRSSPCQHVRQHVRQHVHQHVSYRASQQIKHIATAHALAAANNGSPVKHPHQLRSRTTPNLVKVSNTSQSARFMAPRRPGPKMSAASPIAQRPLLQENIPTDRRITHRRSQVQERTLKRESLAVPGTLNNRRSFGPGSPLAQSREPSFATPPTVRKRMSSHLAQQTPVTVKRIQSEESGDAPPVSPLESKATVVQPHGNDLPTPIPDPIDSIEPVLPRSHTYRDLQRKTLGTPNGLGGVWRSSRALAVTTHEVSRLPRSHTFHNFGNHMEVAPPVPRIPEQYRTSSLADLTQPARMDPKGATPSRHGRVISDANSCESIPEETDEERMSCTLTYTPYPPGQGLRSSMESIGSPVSLAAFPSVPTTVPRREPNTAGSRWDCSSSRLWSVSEPEGLDVADIETFQVKDYMPPLYWAGRFQSRYDQWRTDAMEAELNPTHRPSGLLGECKLNQDKLAACYILGQLRDLCTSDQAADSLWVRWTRVISFVAY